MSPTESLLERAARGLVKLTARPPELQDGGTGETLVFIVDRSGSMVAKCGYTSRIGAARDAIIACLDTRQQMGADDTVMVIAFNETAKLVLPLMRCRDHRPRIDTAIRSITADGGTTIRKPLELALPLLTRQPNVHLVLLSDGQDTEDATSAARRLKNKGVIIETIGVADDPSEVDEGVLKGVASVLNGKVLYRFIRDAHEMVQYFRTDIAHRLVKRGP